jgi:hypothetical protein
MEGARNKTLALIVGWTAAAAFLASWFAPVIKDVPGWMAFRYALAPLVPYRDAGTAGWEDSAPQVMSALTNVVFIILFVLWQLNQTVRPGLFVRIAIACFVLNLYWLVTAWRNHELGDLLVGYYLWLAAFALLLVLAILIASSSRRTSRTPTAAAPS